MNWAALLNGFAFPPALGLAFGVISTRLFPHGHSFRWHFWLYTGWPGFTMTLTALVPLHGWWNPWSVPGTVFWMTLAIWYFTRKRRDRAKAWLGAKSKALRDALVRKARELSQPRPVLRPVPQWR